MKLFAHRGYSGIFPENTMTAFKEAVRTGCYGIELDVQLTKDGTVVVIHDETVNRTTDGTGAVESFSFSELEKLNANRTQPAMAAREHIPSFEEYCSWAQHLQFMTNIELKTGSVYYSGLEQKTIDIIKSYQLEDRMFFSSFNPLSLLAVKAIEPDFSCGLLVERPIVHAGEMCKTFGFDYYHPGLRGLTEKSIEECHDNGIPVHVWTVNSEISLMKLKKWKVDGVFSNFPEMMKLR